MGMRTACVAASLLALAIPLGAQVLDNIVVTGTRISAPTTSGSRVLCTGEGCAYMLMMMQMQVSIEWATENAALPPEDPPVEKERFCNNLRNERPSTCAPNLPPPSTPTYDINWQPNGCGDGRFGSDLANLLIGVIPFGGDLDNPQPGVNFRNACNSQDYCYGMGFGQASCDNQFEVDLNNTCASSSNPMCTGLAGHYARGVRMFGDTAYNASRAETQCAAWKVDMEINQCRQ